MRGGGDPGSGSGRDVGRVHSGASIAAPAVDWAVAALAAVAPPAAVCATVLAVASPSSMAAQELAVVGGEVRPVSGPAIPDGAVIVRDGRIVAVGPRARVRVPDGAEMIDASGMVVTPGLVDARTSLSLRHDGGPEERALLRSTGYRAADRLVQLRVPGRFGMPARETGIHPWTMDGVTTAYVAPDPGSLVAGFGAVVKLAGDRLGPVVDSAAALHLTLGYALPGRSGGPTTRQGMVALLRQWLHRARAAAPGAAFELGRPATEVEGLPPGFWERTPDLTAALSGELPVRFHAYSPDDVLAALRVAREFGLRAVVEGAYGAHLVAAELAEAGVPAVLGPAISGSVRTAGAPDAWARTAEGADRLRRAGVPVALSTDGGGGRAVTVEAIVARGHGLPSEAALRAVTLDAARILGVDDRLGSLEAGKDADLVVWSGDPVGTWGEARVVVVDGRVVFRRAGS